MIATNIPLFHTVNEMPLVLDPARLDAGGGIEETLKKNKAQYHQSCRYLFQNYRLERPRKRPPSPGSTQSIEGCTKRRNSHAIRQPECFVFDEYEPKSDLRQVMTMNLDKRLNDCVQTLNDEKRMGKLSGGDAIAQELPLDMFGRTVQQSEGSQFQEGLQQDVYPLAFSELIKYIVETKSSKEGPSLLRLVDMVQLYKRRLEQIGIEKPDVNSTTLKEKLLAEISELEAHKQERDVILTFDEDSGLALSQASDYSDAIILAKVAKILRIHMLDHTSKFDGTFHDGCIEEAIPSSLVQFVGMIEHGADIKSQLRFVVLKTDLVIAQLLQYNCYATYKEGAATHRHSTNRETPFPIFLGMSVYAKTRKRMLVEMLHEHGISISYDRVLEVSAQLGDAAVSKYMKDGVACPQLLQRGLFTTAASWISLW